MILDGDFRLPNGIHVIDADGVAVENMTARHYLLNGFFWTGVFGYRASFEAIRADVQYRPPRLTPWPSIHGVIHGHVDADTSGEVSMRSIVPPNVPAADSVPLMPLNTLRSARSNVN